MSFDQLPCIAISSGDPAGIGPEITAKALEDDAVRSLARWIVVGDKWILEQATPRFEWRPDVVVTRAADIPAESSVALLEPDVVDRGAFQIGRLSANCGLASLEYVAEATQICLRGEADAMVTAPINKEAVSLAGTHFTGHTEFIAELCDAEESRMLLVNDKLRVVHVTTHCALSDATKTDSQRVLSTIELGHEAMQRLGWENPRLAICGLNPHAGENGLFGNQESTVIEPAVAAARERGIDCVGPFPADTLFLQAYRGKYDMVVAMYHDQGHVPMKLLDFEHTVNVSLGLPIVRTSVDHGTAFDIAGQDLADPEDMKTALRLAIKLVCQRKQSKLSRKTSVYTQ